MTRVSTQIEDDMLEKLHPADHTHNLNTKLHKTHYKMYKITCAVHHQLYAECNFCLPAPFTHSMSHYSPTRPIRTADDFHRDIIFCLASQCRRMIRYTGSIAVQMSSGNTMIMNTVDEYLHASSISAEQCLLWNNNNNTMQQFAVTRSRPQKMQQLQYPACLQRKLLCSAQLKG